MSTGVETPETGHLRKRQRLSQPETPERSSRASYVPKACQSCRRKKTKCSGQSPCDRCCANGSICLYDSSTRRRYVERSRELNHVALQLSQVQEQVRELSNRAAPSVDLNVEATLAQERHLPTPTLPIPASVDTSVSHEASDNLTTFRGPTSAEFTLGLATGNLQSHLNVGEDQSLRNADRPDVAIAAGSEVLVEQNPAAKALLEDPLQDMHLAEAKRLIHVYQNGPGAINPILDTDELLDTCERVFRLLEEARSTRYAKALITAAEQLAGFETITLKLVLANGSALDSCGIDRRARIIFESVRKQLGSSFWALPNLHMIQNWILVAILHYNLDEELQANRVTAHVARLCLELGINRSAILHRSFKNPRDRALAEKLVCNTFVLDRRSSIGIGLPPVIPVEEMDITIKATDNESLYLRSLVNLARIFEDVYQLANQLSDKASTVSIMKIDYLEFQVVQWQNGLPDSFSVCRDDWRDLQDQSREPVQLFRKLILVLRANQIRNLIYRPILYTTERIMAHGNHARTAIRIAREAIQLLTDLSKYHIDILHKNVLLIKYFLVSAFSVLLLAIANYPNAISDPHGYGPLHSSNSVQEEFYMAIDLFKLLSSRYSVLATLWETVQSFQKLTVQAGLQPVSHHDNLVGTSSNARQPEQSHDGTPEATQERDGYITLPWQAEHTNKNAEAGVLDSMAGLTDRPSHTEDNSVSVVEPYDPFLDFFNLDSNLYSSF